MNCEIFVNKRNYYSEGISFKATTTSFVNAHDTSYCDSLNKIVREIPARVYYIFIFSVKKPRHDKDNNDCSPNTSPNDIFDFVMIKH